MTRGRGNVRSRWLVGGMALALLAGCRDKTASTPGQSATQAPGGGGAGDAQAGGSGKPSRADADKPGVPQDAVHIVADSQRRGGITVAPVEAETLPQTLSVTGQVVVDDSRTAHLGTVADGRIVSVSVLPGAAVGRGQTLGTLHSHMVHETAGSLAQAFAATDRARGAVTFALAEQTRYHHLFAIGAASQEESQRADQTLQEAQKAQAEAAATVHMEREHLSELLQVEPESITPANLYARELVPIRAPLAGTVLMRNVSVGQVVPTGFEAFSIASLGTVWVTAAVNQQDLALVHEGAAARVLTQGVGQQSFRGRVGQVGDQLNPDTRTVPVRVVVPNPGERLRPGMFASVEIAGPGTREAIFVPEGAVEDVNGLSAVFTTTDGETFHARTVRTGLHDHGRVEIVEGLRPGERIAVTGAFLVKSELLKSTVGDG